MDSATDLAQLNLLIQETVRIAQEEPVSDVLEATDGMEQITNVSQLRGVSPGEWTFEALRSIVERYGCIAGYPDGTYGGNRATSRYEFAAGLNACFLYQCIRYFYLIDRHHKNTSLEVLFFH